MRNRGLNAVAGRVCSETTRRRFYHEQKGPRANCRAGFTLIELLVVIAVIAILAALLVPKLAKAKASAERAACKNNLRQLGIALRLYVDDYHKYPSNGAIYQQGTFVTFYGRGLYWLKPYVGQNDPVPHQPELVPALYHPDVFTCPARKPTFSTGPFGKTGRYRWHLGYGYNELGTGKGQFSPRLGLGAAWIVPAAWTRNEPLSVLSAVEVSEGDVRSPADMIALGDGANVGVISPNLDPVFHLSSYHGKGDNVAFCDGHVEYGKRTKWLEPTDTMRRRWNNDNQPHPETW